MSRNTIFDALLLFGKQSVVPPGGTTAANWGSTGRRAQDPTQPSCILPALFQVEGDCDYQSKLGQMRRRKEQATWMIYHAVGADQAETPSKSTQDFKDSLDALFGDNGIHLETLGGLVFSVCIEGAVRRYFGDFDGIELITVPLTLILP